MMNMDTLMQVWAIATIVIGLGLLTISGCMLYKLCKEVDESQDETLEAPVK